MEKWRNHCRAPGYLQPFCGRGLLGGMAGLYIHTEPYRAAIIEFAGELPEAGMIFKAKVNEPNQYEMPYKDIYNVHRNWQEAKNPLVRTPVIVSGWQTNFRLFQDSYGHLVPVTTLYDARIDQREQEECEGSVIGPSMAETHGKSGMLYWYSDLCILVLCRCTLMKVIHSGRLRPCPWWISIRRRHKAWLK